MPTALFSIRDLAKVYGMGEVEVQALRNVDLTLYEGEFIVLLGPSGSGKSTLLNILGGLDVPTRGQVFYRDLELTRADESVLTAYRRRHVGFVFQFYNLIPSLTAAENVALVTEIADDPMTPDAALRLAGETEALDRRRRDRRCRRAGRWRRAETAARECLGRASRRAIARDWGSAKP
jgi:putative ABC transport system ATP-binding protein